MAFSPSPLRANACIFNMCSSCVNHPYMAKTIRINFFFCHPWWSYLQRRRKWKMHNHQKEKRTWWKNKLYIYKPKTYIQNVYLDFQVKRQYLHEMKKLTHFGSLLILRYFNKAYFHFTLYLRVWAHT
jgi:hypothetical protein